MRRNSSVVRASDGTGEAQAQAESVSGLRTAGSSGDERVENPVQRNVGGHGPRAPNLENHFIAHLIEPNSDHSARRTVPNGVENEPREHRGDRVGVPFTNDARPLRSEVEPARRVTGLDGIDDQLAYE